MSAPPTPQLSPRGCVVLSSSLFWFKSKKVLYDKPKEWGDMRTYESAKRSEKFQQRIYKKHFKICTESIHNFFLYTGKRWGLPTRTGDAGLASARRGQARKSGATRPAGLCVPPGVLSTPYRASMSFSVWEGGRSLISADRGVVLRGDTGRPPSVEMSGGGALSAAVGGVLLSSPFWWPAVGLMRG